VNRDTAEFAVIQEEEKLKDTHPEPPAGTIALFDGSEFVDCDNAVSLRHRLANRFGELVVEFILSPDDISRSQGIYTFRDSWGLDPKYTEVEPEVYARETKAVGIRGIYASYNDIPLSPETLVEQLLEFVDVGLDKEILKHSGREILSLLHSMWWNKDITPEEFYDLYEFLSGKAEEIIRRSGGCKLDEPK
jgi:hypothetical protein